MRDCHVDVVDRERERERERERVSVHGWCRTVCPIMYARECVMIERQKEREREREREGEGE